MPQPVEMRKHAFSAWVKRALRQAQEDRGWSIPRIADVAGIGNQTIYRWRDGTWAKSPSPDAVVAFCDALDIDASHAFRILWPGKTEAPTEPEPAPMDPDLELLMRRLRDPHVSDEEKVSIRATVRFLARRAAAPRI